VRLAVLFFTLALSACAVAQSPPQAAQQEYDSSASPALIEACDFSDVVIGSPAHAREVRLCRRFQDKAYDKQQRERYRELTRALYAGDCAVLAVLDSSLAKIENDDPVLYAGMLRHGLCVDVDASRAIHVLEQFLDQDPDNVIALAYLGDMLLKGEGAAQDAARAKQLFQMASLYALPNLFEAHVNMREHEGVVPKGRNRDRFYWPHEGAGWALTEFDLALNFAHPVLGPWLLPPPLAERRAWLASLLTAPEEDVVKLATALLEGNNGYPKKPHIAYQLLRSAARSGNQTAALTLISWLRDPDIPTQIVLDKPDDDISILGESWARREAACDVREEADMLIKSRNKTFLADAYAHVLASFEDHPEIRHTILNPKPEQTRHDVLRLLPVNAEYDRLFDAVWQIYSLVWYMANASIAFPDNAEAIFNQIAFERSLNMVAEGPRLSRFTFPILTGCTSDGIYIRSHE